MPSPLLLEIGVEELPARFCAPVLAQLAERGGALLAELGLGAAHSRTYGTPRRLAWLAEGVSERQPDTVRRTRGPARAAAYDAGGNPTQALRGFARSQGLAEGELVLDTVAGKEYVFAQRTVPGRPALELLAERLPGLITGLEFPRAMRWGSGDLRFARPVRWLVALFGERVIPFSLEGVHSGRQTWGHRTLHPAPLEIERAEEYVPVLRSGFVLVDVAERQARIAQGLEAEAAAVGGVVHPDPDLLDELTHINEWPTPFSGRFDPAALEVPAAVLVTVMRHHQRYFPVQDPAGRLLPFFLAVRNGGTHNLEGVRAGNEKVLAARFADARFFFEEDCRRPLGERVPQLEAIRFAEGLGSLLDKTRRVQALAGRLGREVGADLAVVERAALLCKADRLTHVVYELPELEGTMGAAYAARDGEPEAVCRAIAEHVLPRTAADQLPRSLEGSVLGVADRLDTLAGHFLAGRQPSGSADPLGLRRAAAAVIRILEERGWDLGLGSLVAWALAEHASAAESPALHEFLATRLRGRLLELGFAHDVVEAVLASGADGVGDSVVRCRALAAATAEAGWADTLVAFRRAGNLARQGTAAEQILPALFRVPEEGALWEALRDARLAADAAMRTRDYAAVLAATATLRRPVDALLTAVLAMDPDPAVRANRLALLAGVAAVPRPVADLGRLGG